MENKDNKDLKEKQKNEINTSFPMEFPPNSKNLENHIADVVKNEIKPPHPAHVNNQTQI